MWCFKNYTTNNFYSNKLNLSCRQISNKVMWWWWYSQTTSTNWIKLESCVFFFYFKELKTHSFPRLHSTFPFPPSANLLSICIFFWQQQIVSEIIMEKSRVQHCLCCLVNKADCHSSRQSCQLGQCTRNWTGSYNLIANSSNQLSLTRNAGTIRSGWRKCVLPLCTAAEIKV